MAESTAESPRSWAAKFAVESFVIVVSILIAFSLDAWWERSTEINRKREQLEAIQNEFTANIDELQVLFDRLESMRVAVIELLPHISPTSPSLPLDSLTSLMDLSFRLGTVELQTGSIQALLSSGELAGVGTPELTALLAEWPAEVARLRNQSGLLEENREIIIEYLHARIPTLEIAHKTGQMDRYPRSSFEASAEAVQRDMKVEGLFGNRGMMIEDTAEIVSDLRLKASRILALAEEGGLN